jgi:hypothetical protein
VTKRAGPTEMRVVVLEAVDADLERLAPLGHLLRTLVVRHEDECEPFVPGAEGRCRRDSVSA